MVVDWQQKREFFCTAASAWFPSELIVSGSLWSTVERCHFVSKPSRLVRDLMRSVSAPRPRKLMDEFPFSSTPLRPQHLHLQSSTCTVSVCILTFPLTFIASVELCCVGRAAKVKELAGGRLRGLREEGLNKK